MLVVISTSTHRRQMNAPLGRLPPLNSIRAFVAAARHLSFSKAANELFVTPAAVSQQVKLLEDHLGVRLFRRSNKALVLTSAGQACLPGLLEGFSAIAQALAQLKPGDRAGPLTVSVAPSFAAKWLIPRLESFQTLHPDIDVRVSASMHLVDFEIEEVDCAIRYGSGGYEGLMAEKILSESVTPAISPDLLSRHGPIKSPENLAGLTLLHDDSPDQDPSCPTWAMWLRAAGVEGIDTSRGLHFNQSSLVLEAAVAGRGVALAKSRLAAEDLAAGRLVQIFDARQPVDFAYYFVAPPTRAAIGKVEAFRDWLRRQASAQ